MTEPTRPRPVPGPPVAAEPPGSRPAGTELPEVHRAGAFADLADRPVSEHVAVFEAEHARLQRELDTIDRL